MASFHSMMESSPIEVRNFQFGLSADRIPKHWLNGRKAVTRFFDNLSIFFPAGERFFVSSVRTLEKNVTDEKLRCEVAAFVSQEGIHTREHVRYNEMLAAQGLPVAKIEARVKRILSFVAKNAPKRRRLAVTCALEHFTSLLGHLVLEDAEGLAGADPEMAALWRWHAAEENEHKAVAFDVYNAVGGKYPERVLVMVGATVIFWGLVLDHQIQIMRAEGLASSPREWADLVSFLFVRPGPLPKLVPPYLQYFRRDFHPNDIDSSAALRRWKEAARAH